jgi:hypothetical protein
MASHDDRHRVYMSFQDRYGWQCQFLEADLKTPLPRKLHFTSPDKIVELVERGGGFPNQESRLMLEQGIAMGRGGVLTSPTRVSSYDWSEAAGSGSERTPSGNAGMTLSIVGGDRGWKILRQEAQIIEMMHITAI